MSPRYQLKILEFLISIYIKLASVTVSLPEWTNHIEHLYVAVDDRVPCINYPCMKSIPFSVTKSYITHSK